MNPADPQTRRETVRSLLAGAVFWFVTLLYLETVLHVIIFGGLTLRYLYLMGFTAVIAAIPMVHIKNARVSSSKDFLWMMQ